MFLCEILRKCICLFIIKVILRNARCNNEDKTLSSTELCSRTLLVLLFLRIAGVSYGRFMAMRCKLICQRVLRTVGDR